MAGLLAGFARLDLRRVAGIARPCPGRSVDGSAGKSGTAGGGSGEDRNAVPALFRTARLLLQPGNIITLSQRPL
jgi:hypothetical protein